MSGFGSLKAEKKTISKIDVITKKLKHPNYANTVDFLCDFYLFTDAEGGLKQMDEITEILVAYLDKLKEKGPAVAELQFRKFFERLVIYGRENKIEYKG